MEGKWLKTFLKILFQHFIIVYFKKGNKSCSFLMCIFYQICFLECFYLSWNNYYHIFQLSGKHWGLCHLFIGYFSRLSRKDLYFRSLQYRNCLDSKYFHKPRFKPLFSNLHMMAVYDYLDYIFNAQVSSYEAPMNLSSLVEKSVEMTEMYSSLINKEFILNKMQVTNFLNGELVPLFHLSLFQKRSPAFASC